jgi:hypothetical protein
MTRAMTKVVLFDLPLPEKPEPCTPEDIQHGCDYDCDGNAVNYYYNFIGYTWKLGGRALYAKTYLEEIERVDITVSESQFRDMDASAKVLQFLQRRFLYIYTLESNGCALRYKARNAPDPQS